MVKDTLIMKLKDYKFFSDLLTEKALSQFKRYLVTGFLSFGIEYLTFALLYVRFKLWYLLANTIVYVIVFWFNFLMNRFWSFSARGNLKRQLILYGILFAFNLCAITALMYLLSDMMGITPLISKFFVMGAVVSWNFVLYKKIIYK